MTKSDPPAERPAETDASSLVRIFPALPCPACLPACHMHARLCLRDSGQQACLHVRTRGTVCFCTRCRLGWCRRTGSSGHRNSLASAKGIDRMHARTAEDDVTGRSGADRRPRKRAAIDTARRTVGRRKMDVLDEAQA
ncbi:unnamed protein product [Protopolystoma xenopodis]|uniref:Uncharacterized protein n=1 Tax=Protopolystoma xenopodis TaxID=117903 RepID=A0A3S5BSS9_9PLAT|nr:unnamed protein product [Protopolystoma xenopodis]